jgi:hypothetical protein
VPDHDDVVALLDTLRRSLLVPSSALVLAAAAGLAWFGAWLAGSVLGGSEGFVDEVRAACLPFAAALALSLAEPLLVAREARAGLLTLRAARGGGFALGWRWAGLALATLPAVAFAALAGGAWPAHPLSVLLDLSILCAGGVFLGAWLERGLLVPALWCLLVAGHLRPWVSEHWAAWLLPRLGDLAGPAGLLHAALWCGAFLLLANHRLGAVVGRSD